MFNMHNYLCYQDLDHPHVSNNERCYIVFLTRNKHIVNWNDISAYVLLSDRIIDRFANYLNWELMRTEQTLSKYIKRKYARKLQR